MAAGTCTITEKRVAYVHLITFTWTSDASGVVSSAAGGTTVSRYTGSGLFFATVPGSGVSSYAISLLDSNGLDILCGSGSGRSTTLTEYLKQASLGAIAEDTLTLAVTGAGNAKTGTAYLWVH